MLPVPALLQVCTLGSQQLADLRRGLQERLTAAGMAQAAVLTVLLEAAAAGMLDQPDALLAMWERCCRALGREAAAAALAEPGAAAVACVMAAAHAGAPARRRAPRAALEAC